MMNGVLMILVCGNESSFTDDIQDVCILCFSRVYVRPYLDNIKYKVCSSCGQRLMYEHGVPQNVEVLDQTMNDVLNKMKNIS